MTTEDAAERYAKGELDLAGLLAVFDAAKAGQDEPPAFNPWDEETTASALVRRPRRLLP